MSGNQGLKTDPEIREMPVTCVNFNCFKSVKVKNSIVGARPGEFFCSESCLKQHIGK